MDPLHRTILQTNRSFIVDEIHDIEGIVDDLCAKDVLTEPMRQDIMVSPFCMLFNNILMARSPIYAICRGYLFFFGERSIFISSSGHHR